MDRLTQHLAALHAYMDALGTMTPEDCIVDACEATEGLPLATLAARLSGIGVVSAIPADGVCELFD